MTDWVLILEEIRNGRTLLDMSAELGISESYLSRLFNRERSITASVKQRIVKAYPRYMPLFLQEIMFNSKGDLQTGIVQRENIPGGEA